MTSSARRVFIIGAGLSGLAATARLVEEGVNVSVYDAAGHAGGRCRSFYDRTLDRTIDNGNHLIMSGNRHALRYLDRIGSTNALTGPPFAQYPFVDIGTNERWVVRINDGFIPFWIFDKQWRVPGSKLMDYLKAGKIVFAGANKTVADAVDKSNILYARFWEPLTLAALNATPDAGQAKLLWSVIRETFALGGTMARPLVAKQGLGPAFIDPAVSYIRERGGEIHFNHRLRSLRIENGRVTGLDFPEGMATVGESDEVILAVPPSRLKQLMPEVDPPADDASILNVHYRTSAPNPARALGPAPFIGVLSSDAQWIFVRDDVISITVSASHAIGMDDVPNTDVVEKLWRETQAALDLGDAPYDAVRVIRERRATPDQSPAGAAKRVKAETAYANLTLAGDHTDTGVPATIEGAIRSGDKAAGIVIGKTTKRDG